MADALQDSTFLKFVGAVACEVQLPVRVWLVPECPAGSPTRLAVGVTRDRLAPRAQGPMKAFLEYDSSECALLLQVRADGALVPIHAMISAPNSGLIGANRDGLLRDVEALAQAHSVLLLQQQAAPCPTLVSNLRNGIFSSEPEPVILADLVRQLAPHPLARTHKALSLFCELNSSSLSELDWRLFLAQLAAVPAAATPAEALHALHQLGDVEALASALLANLRAADARQGT